MSEQPRQMISAVSTVVASRDQVSRDFGEEAAVLNLNTGIYYGLNAVGARVWSLISQPKTVNEILDMLLQEYDVETGRCKDDLMRFIGKLAEVGLIEVMNEGAP